MRLDNNEKGQRAFSISEMMRRAENVEPGLDASKERLLLRHWRVEDAERDYEPTGLIKM